MTEQNITIGEKTKSLRIKKNMSIEEVSRESGIPESIISGIEDHSGSPPLAKWKIRVGVPRAAGKGQAAIMAIR